jgi:hypothetical protein
VKMLCAATDRAERRTWVQIKSAQGFIEASNSLKTNKRNLKMWEIAGELPRPTHTKICP